MKTKLLLLIILLNIKGFIIQEHIDMLVVEKKNKSIAFKRKDPLINNFNISFLADFHRFDNNLPFPIITIMLSDSMFFCLNIQKTDDLFNVYLNENFINHSISLVEDRVVPDLYNPNDCTQAKYYKSFALNFNIDTENNLILINYYFNGELLYTNVYGFCEKDKITEDLIVNFGGYDITETLNKGKFIFANFQISNLTSENKQIPTILDYLLKLTDKYSYSNTIPKYGSKIETSIHNNDSNISFYYKSKNNILYSNLYFNSNFNISLQPRNIQNIFIRYFGFSINLNIMKLGSAYYYIENFNFYNLKDLLGNNVLDLTLKNEFKKFYLKYNDNTIKIDENYINNYMDNNSNINLFLRFKSENEIVNTFESLECYLNGKIFFEYTFINAIDKSFKHNFFSKNSNTGINIIYNEIAFLYGDDLTINEDSDNVYINLANETRFLILDKKNNSVVNRLNKLIKNYLNFSDSNENNYYLNNSEILTNTIYSSDNITSCNLFYSIQPNSKCVDKSFFNNSNNLNYLFDPITQNYISYTYIGTFPDINQEFKINEFYILEIKVILEKNNQDEPNFLFDDKLDIFISLNEYVYLIDKNISNDDLNILYKEKIQKLLEPINFYRIVNLSTFKTLNIKINVFKIDQTTIDYISDLYVAKGTKCYLFSKYYSSFDLNVGKCVNNCSDNTIIDNQNYICIPKISNCMDQELYECNTCLPTFTKYLNTCISGLEVINFNFLNYNIFELSVNRSIKTLSEYFKLYGNCNTTTSKNPNRDFNFYSDPEEEIKNNLRNHIKKNEMDKNIYENQNPDEQDPLNINNLRKNHGKNINDAIQRNKNYYKDYFEYIPKKKICALYCSICDPDTGVCSKCMDKYTLNNNECILTQIENDRIYAKANMDCTSCENCVKNGEDICPNCKFCSSPCPYTIKKTKDHKITIHIYELILNEKSFPINTDNYNIVYNKENKAIDIKISSTFYGETIVPLDNSLVKESKRCSLIIQVPITKSLPYTYFSKKDFNTINFWKKILSFLMYFLAQPYASFVLNSFTSLNIYFNKLCLYKGSYYSFTPFIDFIIELNINLEYNVNEIMVMGSISKDKYQTLSKRSEIYKFLGWSQMKLIMLSLIVKLVVNFLCDLRIKLKKQNYVYHRLEYRIEQIRNLANAFNEYHVNNNLLYLICFQADIFFKLIPLAPLWKYRIYNYIFYIIIYANVYLTKYQQVKDIYKKYNCYKNDITNKFEDDAATEIHEHISYQVYYSSNIAICEGFNIIASIIIALNARDDAYSKIFSGSKYPSLARFEMIVSIFTAILFFVFNTRLYWRGFKSVFLFLISDIIWLLCVSTSEIGYKHLFLPFIYNLTFIVWMGIRIWDSIYHINLFGDFESFEFNWIYKNTLAVSWAILERYKKYFILKNKIKFIKYTKVSFEEYIFFEGAAIYYNGISKILPRFKTTFKILIESKIQEIENNINNKALLELLVTFDEEDKKGRDYSNNRIKRPKKGLHFNPADYDTKHVKLDLFQEMEYRHRSLSPESNSMLPSNIFLFNTNDTETNSFDEEEEKKEREEKLIREQNYRNLKTTLVEINEELKEKRRILKEEFERTAEDKTDMVKLEEFYQNNGLDIKPSDELKYNSELNCFIRKEKKSKNELEDEIPELREYKSNPLRNCLIDLSDKEIIINTSNIRDNILRHNIVSYEEKSDQDVESSLKENETIEYFLNCKSGQNNFKRNKTIDQSKEEGITSTIENLEGDEKESSVFNTYGNEKNLNDHDQQEKENNQIKSDNEDDNFLIKDEKDKAMNNNMGCSKINNLIFDKEEIKISSDNFKSEGFVFEQPEDINKPKNKKPSDKKTKNDNNIDSLIDKYGYGYLVFDNSNYSNENYELIPLSDQSIITYNSDLSKEEENDNINFGFNEHNQFKNDESNPSYNFKPKVKSEEEKKEKEIKKLKFEKKIREANNKYLIPFINNIEKELEKEIKNVNVDHFDPEEHKHNTSMYYNESIINYEYRMRMQLESDEAFDYIPRQKTNINDKNKDEEDSIKNNNNRFERHMNDFSDLDSDEFSDESLDELKYQTKPNIDTFSKYIKSQNKKKSQINNSGKNKDKSQINNSGKNKDKSPINNSGENKDKSQINNSGENLDKSQINNSGENLDKSVQSNQEKNINKSQINNPGENIDKSQINNSGENIDKFVQSNQEENINKSQINNSGDNIDKLPINNSEDNMSMSLENSPEENSDDSLQNSYKKNLDKSLQRILDENVDETSINNSEENVNKSEASDPENNSDNNSENNSDNNSNSELDPKGKYLYEKHDYWYRDNFYRDFQNFRKIKDKDFGPIDDDEDENIEWVPRTSYHLDELQTAEEIETELLKHEIEKKKYREIKDIKEYFENRYKPDYEYKGEFYVEHLESRLDNEYLLQPVGILPIVIEHQFNFEIYQELMKIKDLEFKYHKNDSDIVLPFHEYKQNQNMLQTRIHLEFSDYERLLFDYQSSLFFFKTRQIPKTAENKQIDMNKYESRLKFVDQLFAFNKDKESLIKSFKHSLMNMYNETLFYDANKNFDMNKKYNDRDFYVEIDLDSNICIENVIENWKLKKDDILINFEFFDMRFDYERLKLKRSKSKYFAHIKERLFTNRVWEMVNYPILVEYNQEEDERYKRLLELGKTEPEIRGRENLFIDLVYCTLYEFTNNKEHHFYRLLETKFFNFISFPKYSTKKRKFMIANFDNFLEKWKRMKKTNKIFFKAFKSRKASMYYINPKLKDEPKKFIFIDQGQLNQVGQHKFYTTGTFDVLKTRTSEYCSTIPENTQENEIFSDMDTEINSKNKQYCKTI